MSTLVDQARRLKVALRGWPFTDDSIRKEASECLGQLADRVQELESTIQEALKVASPVQPEKEERRLKPDDVDRLLREVFAVCEATEDAPGVEPRNEHQRGFDKGRRFEAKQIRRAIGNWFQSEFCGRSFMGEPVVEQKAPRSLCLKCGRHHPNPDCKYMVPSDFAHGISPSPSMVGREDTTHG